LTPAVVARGRGRRYEGDDRLFGRAVVPGGKRVLSMNNIGDAIVHSIARVAMADFFYCEDMTTSSFVS
jgi:hypothetical protein